MRLSLASMSATIRRCAIPRPELLAQHLTLSGRVLEAAALWLRAGILAKEMGSSIEALARLDRCLECLGEGDGSRGNAHHPHALPDRAWRADQRSLRSGEAERALRRWPRPPTWPRRWRMPPPWSIP
jgi:hypothetical protein